MKPSTAIAVGASLLAGLGMVVFMRKGQGKKLWKSLLGGTAAASQAYATVKPIAKTLLRDSYGKENPLNVPLESKNVV
ncbi:MAG: hypothetical protein KIT11_01510 [Fimbriimonadaceae bacterium]|nr:hypothetical protein [Fimbriimonadaceae bacterium]QYK54952.1 MAG: hypothetical protein KF733_08025 [Fimbriimonadaceae bacterium]